jgi:hypothetical protein
MQKQSSDLLVPDLCCIYPKHVAHNRLQPGLVDASDPVRIDPTVQIRRTAHAPRSTAQYSMAFAQLAAPTV